MCVCEREGVLDELRHLLSMVGLLCHSACLLVYDRV